jgi:hypothetical protein
MDCVDMWRRRGRSRGTETRLDSGETGSLAEHWAGYGAGRWRGVEVLVGSAVWCEVAVGSVPQANK